MKAHGRTADLIVIGAGPKAAAIAAKTHVLNELGYGPLQVKVVERKEVAASWTGRHGFTSGYEALGTQPEKDVGFPYQTATRLGVPGQQIDQAMLQFSWHNHLIQMGEYRRWVDLGTPRPTHREVARYLSWVLERATNGVDICLANVTRCELSDDGWRVTCETDGNSGEVLVAERGVVLTGPGAPKTLPYAKDVAHRIFSPKVKTEDLEAMYLPPAARICIIGSGESAVSLALWLISKHGEDLGLTFVAPTLPYSRAESFFENSVYSDPQLVGWGHLTEGQRAEFVRRTDRGVMSIGALERLARHRALSFVVGRVQEIQRHPSRLARVVVNQADEMVRHEFDAVAICTGSSPAAELARLLGDSKSGVEERLGCSVADESSLMRRIDSTLALRGLSPRIYLPALAGLAQGPGFANLSSLGMLSDCILLSCVYAADEGVRSALAETLL